LAIIEDLQMSTVKEKENIIEKLRLMTNAEFVEFFYKLVEVNKNRIGNDISEVYVLSSSGYFDCDEQHTSNFFALPKDGFDSIGYNVSANQFGQCEKCKAKIISFTKHAICPICEEEVECT